jgi:hypothetical protein
MSRIGAGIAGTSEHTLHGTLHAEVTSASVVQKEKQLLKF